MSHPPPPPPSPLASLPVVTRLSAIMESGSDTIGFGCAPIPVDANGVPVAVVDAVNRYSRSRPGHMNGCMSDVHLHIQSATTLTFRCVCEGVVIYVGLN